MSIIDAIAAVRAKNGKRPCDCESCACGNSGDTYSVGSWDGTEWALAEIEKALAPVESRSQSAPTSTSSASKEKA